MNYDEFKEKEKAINADFAERIADLAKQQGAEIGNAWNAHLQWKLENCQVAAGNFVEYCGKNWVVLEVKTEAMWRGGRDVFARLKRVKKDLSPTARDEFLSAIPEKLKKIELKGGQNEQQRN